MKHAALLLLLLCACAGAADMPHCTIELKPGTQYTGWWAADQGVVYCDDGSRHWIEDQTQIVTMTPVATQEKAPAKQQFQRLPDLPFCAVKVTGKGGDDMGRYVGWWDAEARLIFPVDGKMGPQRYPIDSYDVKMEPTGRQQPPPSQEIRAYLDRKAIEGVKK